VGCDIHTFVEVKKEPGRGWDCIGPSEMFADEWGPFAARNYGVFAFLADVRNYSAIRCPFPVRGFPEDASSEVREEYRQDGEGYSLHGISWITVAELLAVDYDAVIEDRRVTVQRAPGWWDGGATAEPGEGKREALREFLGPEFMQDLDALGAIAAWVGDPARVRVVFWFDN
jgi:hypothetical protein